MNAREFIPMIDLAFLSLGAIVAILSQTQLVRALPIEVSEVQPGVAAICRDDLAVITIRNDQFLLDGQPVALHELADRVDGRLALLRVDRQVPTHRLVRAMGALATRDVELRIEVEEGPSKPRSRAAREPTP